MATSPWLQRLTAITRGLLAVGFLQTSLIKALGGRFTNQPPDNPVEL